MVQYEEVANAIRKAVERIFKKKLSEEEIAYMVLHFANSLERSRKKAISVLQDFRQVD